MTRRQFTALPLAGAGLPALSGAQPAAAPERPSVLWVFGDQHRAQALGTNGDPNVRTPNLDNLAALSVNFTAALSGFPLYCPFRGSLMTGRYPHQCIPGHEFPLPAGQDTIARPFEDAGYHTAYFGKWHLDSLKEGVQGRSALHIVPPERRGGFDVWAGYDNNNRQWDSWVHGGAGKDAFHYRLPGYETDALTDLLIRYLKERSKEAKAGRSQPFFAVLSVQPPHDPYVAPAEFMRRYNGAKLELRPDVPPVAQVQETARRDLAGYYAMIENLDRNLGRIFQALDEAELSFNTHILFFSDHGDMHGSHGMYRKTNPFEESIRIPFIIGGEIPRYHGRLSGRFPVPLNHVDIAPTTLGLCGLARPAWMAGTDYSHYRLQSRRKTTPSEPDSAYLQNVVPTGHAHSINKSYRGLVTRDGWKYICFEGTCWLLFNLNEDPYELVNLAHNSRYRAERRRQIERLNQWISDTDDKFTVPGD